MRGVACAAVASFALSGCFVQVGMSYSPSSTITVQRTSDPTPVTIKDGTATINFRIGANFDILGVGLHYAWYAARVIRSAPGLPRQPNAYGQLGRLDVDLPVRFGPDKLLGLRASYQWESFEKFNNGPLVAGGGGKHYGLTLTTLRKDVALSVMYGHYHFQSDNTFSNDMAFPVLGVDTPDLDIGLTIRFLPSGKLLDHYVPEPSSPIFTISNCGWRLAKDGGGFTCE